MNNLVELRDLNIRFSGERTVHAVNDLSLTLGEGEVLGLLGESGSGKSVTLRALMRLLPRKRTQISGSVRGSRVPRDAKSAISVKMLCASGSVALRVRMGGTSRIESCGHCRR